MLLTSALLLFFIILCEAISKEKYEALPEELKTKDRNDIHGGVKMGVPSKMCDNGKWHLEVDLKHSTINHFCYVIVDHFPDELSHTLVTETNEKPPIHVCLPEEIVYDENLPTTGMHRPLWPKYGAYNYLPVQRWLHSIEHGAAVFLYHPCVPTREKERFQKIAFSCMKKIIVTPSLEVPKSTPFVVAVYKSKLLMNRIDESLIVEFLQRVNWEDIPEYNVWEDGSYNLYLEKSSYQSTNHESNYRNVCPDMF
ncbi:uncharacterized protein LOC115222628 isoform X1 [Argonauta hians]